MPAGPLSPLPSLLAWAAGSIGPRVARLLLAQLLLLTLVAGVNSRLFAQLVPALRADADLRTATLASIAIAVAASRHPLRHALCPPSLAALRRQPLGTASFALLALPWAAPLAWSWALVPALGHLDAPHVAITAWLLGTLAVGGVAAATTRGALATWTLVPLALTLLVDRVDALALPVLIAAATFGAREAGRSVRLALVPERGAPLRSAGRAPLADTPLGALLTLDASVLRTRLHWLWTAPLPIVIALYVLVLDVNGNCRGDCLDRAALVATTFGAGCAVAVLDALRHVHGARLLAPDRVVPTRLRLASLFLVTLAPLLPFVAVLAVRAGEVSLLPHAAAVALAVLWLQLRDTTRAAELGPLAWTLLALTAVALLPDTLRLASSTALAIALAALVDRRGRRLRAELAAARGPSTRY